MQGAAVARQKGLKKPVCLLLVKKFGQTPMKKLIASLACGVALISSVAFAQTMTVVINSGLFEPYAVAVDADNNYCY